MGVFLLKTEYTEMNASTLGFLCLFVFQPIFTMSAQQSQLKNMTGDEFEKLRKEYARENNIVSNFKSASE